jgi:hypothetical protein
MAASSGSGPGPNKPELVSASISAKAENGLTVLLLEIRCVVVHHET